MRAYHLLEGYDRNKTLANFGNDIMNQAMRSSDRMTKMYLHGLNDMKLRKRTMGVADDGDAGPQAWKAYNLSQFLEVLEEADPTPKKAFVRYLVQWYIDGSMRYLEDAEKATKGLLLYGKFKNRNLPALNTLDFGEFLDLADDLAGFQSQTEESKAEEEGYYRRGQATKIMDNTQFKVVQPKCWEAAQFFGRGTRWCTSSDDSDENFEHYSQIGPLYIILFKGENKRWQFQPSGGDYMDAKDELLTDEQIAPVADVLGPVILNNDPKIAVKMTDPPLEAVERCIERDAATMKSFIERNPKWKHEIPRDVQYDAVRRHPFNYTYCGFVDDDQFKWAVIESHTFGRLSLVKNPNSLMVTHAINANGTEIQFIKNPTDEQLVAAVQTSPNVLTRLMNTPADSTGRAAITKRLISLRGQLVQANKECLPLLPAPYCYEEKLQLLALSKWGLGAGNYIMAHTQDGTREKEWLSYARAHATLDKFWPSVVNLWDQMLATQSSNAGWQHFRNQQDKAA